VDETDTWGEFGARVEGEMTNNIALDIDVTGTSGGPAGTDVHGGVSMSDKFQKLHTQR
jgi:hypothetical protein